MSLTFRFAKDNDYDVFLLGIPSGITPKVFLATAATQAATPLHAALEVDAVYGTYDIPADGEREAMPAVACHKATFEGDALTTHAGSYVGGAQLALIVRDGANFRRFAMVDMIEIEELAAP